jgi:Domain of unknown function (DUF1874).
MTLKPVERLVFLNALPVNAIPYQAFNIYCKRVAFNVIQDLVLTAKTIENYIRHEGTVNTLNRVLGLDLKPSPALYTHRHGDVLVIVTLKTPKIPARGVEVREVDIQDLDILMCTVGEYIV